MHLVESSISLKFPDDNFFRICDCKEYRYLNNIREMDICWFDQKKNKLFLIELKNWENATIEEENDPAVSTAEIEERKTGIHNYRIKNLLEKSIDSMCIFSSILLERSSGKRFNRDFPFDINLKTEIILLSIINQRFAR